MSKLSMNKRVASGVALGLAGVMMISAGAFAFTGTDDLTQQPGVTSAGGPTGYGRVIADGGANYTKAEATPWSPTVFAGGSNLKISGSTTVYPILNAAMPGFVAAQLTVGNHVTPDLQQGGSGWGRSDGGVGLNDLTASSSTFPTTGRFGLQTDNVTPMWDVQKVARDGIEVIINNSVNAADPAHQVTQLSFAQIANIYNGDITNWSQVGGPNMAIHVFAREIGGGTRTSFMDFIKSSGTRALANDANGAPTEATNITVTRGEGNPGVIALVDTNDGSAYGGIGYVGYGFTQGHVNVTSLQLSKTGSAGTYIAATPATVYGTTYPMARYLQVATLHGWSNPRPGAAANAAAFESYLLTDAGQNAAVAANFLSLWAPADVNKDGGVGISDVAAVGGHWNQTGTNHWIRADVNGDGIVGISDVAAVGGWWNFSYPLP